MTSSDKGTETDSKEDYEKSHGNLATFFSAYISLTNTIIGSGVLGLPYAFSCTGWFLGLILLVVCATLSAMSLHLLTLCASRTAKPSSFYAVAEIVAPGYALLIDMAVALKCFGVATSYLIVIGDLMPDVMQELNITGIWLHRSSWVVIGFLVVAPLSFFDSLNAFKWTSTVSLIFIAIIAAVVIAYALPSYSGLNPCLGFTTASDREVDATAITRHHHHHYYHHRSLSVLSDVGMGWTGTWRTHSHNITTPAFSYAAGSPGSYSPPEMTPKTSHASRSLFTTPFGLLWGGTGSFPSLVSDPKSILTSPKALMNAAYQGCIGDILAFVDHPHTILRVLPIFVFGFTCQQNIFSVVNELRMPTQQRYQHTPVSHPLR